MIFSDFLGGGQCHNSCVSLGQHVKKGLERRTSPGFCSNSVSMWTAALW